MNPKANKIIHHEITQPASIREYGFYMNPNDVTRPNIMNSLNRPQSKSMDSTQKLAFTNKSKGPKETITGIKSLNRTQRREYGCNTHPNAT